MQFTVRRETKNKGRSFYSCQKKGDRGNKCDFFLWSEDARQREVDAVFGNNGAGGPSGGTTATMPHANSNNKKSAMKQTTIHTSITPRAERRHYTERTPITSLADLDFGGGGGGDGGGGSSSSKGKDKGKGASAATAITVSSTTPSAGSATLRANSGSSNNKDAPPPEDLDDSDISTDAEDELARLADAATPGGASHSSTMATATGSKRKRPSEEEVENADEYSDFSSGEEEQLAEIVGRSEKKQNAFATPALGAARTRDVDVTDGMPTPLTGKPVRRVLFSTNTTTAAAEDPPSTSEAATTGTVSSATSKRQRVNEDGDFATPSSSPATAATAAATPGSKTTMTDITHEVMALLRGRKLEEPVLRDVRAALDRHAAKARGLERGRDASRQAAKNAEARIAELQARVADLESRQKTDAEARRKLRSGIMELYGKS